MRDAKKPQQKQHSSVHVSVSGGCGGQGENRASQKQHPWKGSGFKDKRTQMDTWQGFFKRWLLLAGSSSGHVS